MRTDPSIREQDQVSDEVNKLYGTKDGRASLIQKLMELGSVAEVDASLQRQQTYTERRFHDQLQYCNCSHGLMAGMPVS